MDRVSDYGSEGWGFKSLRGRVFYKIRVIYLKGTEENSEKVE